MNILNYWWQILSIGLLLYLMANINFAIIFSKGIAKRDIRSVGSGNPGTTNVVRVFGLKLGAPTFICDMMKGIVAALVGKFVFGAMCNDAQVVTFATYFFALCAVLGHIYPVTLGFKGGKGIATSLGFFLCINPLFTACSLLVAVAIILITDKVSIFALIHITGQFIFVIVKFLLDTEMLSSGVAYAVIAAVGVMWGVIVFAHRTNIVRLLSGKENPSGIKASIFKKKCNE